MITDTPGKGLSFSSRAAPETNAILRGFGAALAAPAGFFWAITEPVSSREKRKKAANAILKLVLFNQSQFLRLWMVALGSLE